MKMNYFVFIILTSTILIQISECIKVFDEKAWMDSKGRDKYFEYSDLTQPSIEISIDGQNYSNNVDVDQFKEMTTQTSKNNVRKHIVSGRYNKNQSTHSSSNVIDLFLNTIKKVINPEKQSTTSTTQRHYHNKNETSKGIDIKLDKNLQILPSFGNNQDMQFIFLGTKWCGSGDVAKSVNDIGYFYLTDHCCREHDLCDQIIEPSSEKYGLKNSGKFTRLHCDCDEKFFKCLKRVNTLISKQVGIVYFNVLGHQCFKEDYPVIKCTQTVKSRCVSWSKNEKQSKTYQWFDNKWF